jgi:hypothetical protein
MAAILANRASIQALAATLTASFALGAIPMMLTALHILVRILSESNRANKHGEHL